MMMQSVLEPTRQRQTAPATSSGIDALKALAILLVIMGHTPLPGPLGKLIYLFHVPLFFFASGLVASYIGRGLLTMKQARRLAGTFGIFVILGVSSTRLMDHWLHLPEHAWSTGSIDMEFGLGLLMEVDSTLGPDSLDVHVTGGGKCAGRLRTLLEEHDLPLVHDHGFIPTEELLTLEERASGYLILQDADSPYYPSKFFYYLGRLKPVFVNRCSLFEPYLSIPNAFAIDRPADAATVIQQHIDREFDHQTARIMMQDYNEGIGKALGELLLGGAYET